MKTLLRPISGIMLLLFVGFTSFAQITITTEHMPDAGDTVRISSNTYGLSAIPDPSLTGQGYQWNYSGLEASSQEVMQFVSPLQTPAIYQFTFNPQIANLARPLNSIDFVDMPFSDIFEYYKNTETAYVRAGFAAKILNFPVPMKYSQPERLYKFPLTVNSQPDTSISEIIVQYPSVAYFHLYRQRINEVDGYGTLNTPYGTFNTLRVKSTIFERDSLYLDSLGTGAPVIRNIIEYQWLSAEHPVPVLTISAEGPAYTVRFIDSVKNITPLVVDLGNEMTICKGEEVTLNAQVSGGFPPYQYLWNTLDTTVYITVSPDESMTYTVMVSDITNNIAIDTVRVNVTPFEPLELVNDTVICAQNSVTLTIPGTYDAITWYVNNVQLGSENSISIDSTGIGLGTVTLRAEVIKNGCTDSQEISITFQICDGLSENNSIQLSIAPNPAGDYLILSTEEGFSEPSIFIYSVSGELNNTSSEMIDTNRISVNTTNLKPGVYSILLKDNKYIYTGRFVKR